MRSPKVIILAGADIADYDWARQQINDDDTIICADGGARHAKAMDIMPDIIIGDFDSIDPNALKFYKGQCKIIHDSGQNTTDLTKALNIAPAGKNIDILGATGQRADHDFSNYLILLNLPHPDIIVLKTPTDERRIIKSRLSFQAKIGEMVGVFPLLPIKNLSYEGLEYATEGLGQPYELGWNGACNPVIAPNVKININGGAALVTRTYVF